VAEDGDATADEPLPPAPVAVVLDIGEVIIDETRVWATWAEMAGVSPLTFASVLGAAIVQGESFPAAFAHVAPNLAWQELLDEHERRYGGFRREDVYGDVESCLRELREQGCTVVLAGNQPAHRTAQLRALDLPVDAIATSDELGAEKPTGAFYDAVMGMLPDDTPRDRVLYVGDRVDNDVLPAAAAGMRTCWLRRGPWGVLQDLPDGEDADLVLDGLGELPVLLADWADAAGDAVDEGDH
jgi:FMN phosphatase YigB (HAD superfamily)